MKQLELIYEYIHTECFERCCYGSGAYQEIFRKINNAAMMLVNNAACYLRKENPIINSTGTNLTPETTKKILTMIYKYLQDADTPYQKEKNIRKLLADYQLNPDVLLKTNL